MCECFTFKHFPARPGLYSPSGARESLWHQKALKFNPLSIRFLVVPSLGEKNLGAGSSAVSRPGTVKRQKSQENRDTNGDSPQDKQGKAFFCSDNRHSWEEFAAFSWLFSSWLLDICRHKIDRWPFQPFWEQQMSREPVKISGLHCVWDQFGLSKSSRNCLRNSFAGIERWRKYLHF